LHVDFFLFFPIVLVIRQSRRSSPSGEQPVFFGQDNAVLLFATRTLLSEALFSFPSFPFPRALWADGFFSQCTNRFCMELRFRECFPAYGPFLPFLFRSRLSSLPFLSHGTKTFLHPPGPFFGADSSEFLFLFSLLPELRARAHSFSLD